MKSAGFDFDVIPAKGEEFIPHDAPPEQAAIALARQKAEEVHATHKNSIIIGADTIVAIDGSLLGKPADNADAFSMLKRLSGRRHYVFTGVAVIKPNEGCTTFCEKTEVEFHELSDDEINAYIATGEPFDKAGAYGIQEKGMTLIKRINGDFYNVMGLPISRVARQLRGGDANAESVGEQRYCIGDLLEIMAKLRVECPWDREQSHTTIRTNVIEEAYEVAEAIDDKTADNSHKNTDNLCEELGDLLLQVVFHARIAGESGDFDFDDICDGICRKLIYRHPHVYGEVKADTVGTVLKNWDELKSDLKKEHNTYDRLTGVPKSLPALMRGEKVGKRAANTGFDFADTNEVLDCLKSEIEELESALNADLGDLHKKDCRIEAEFGDILFACCNLGRFLKKDCEKALTFSINRFIMRFGRLENIVLSSGKRIEELNRNQLDELWQFAKKQSNQA